MESIRIALGVMILLTIGAGAGFATVCQLLEVEAQPGVCIIDGTLERDAAQ